MSGPDRAAHQLDVVNGGAGRTEAGGGFHEIRPGHFREHARDDFLIVIEQSGFENHFDDGAAAMAAAATSAISSSTARSSSAAQSADVQHHVDLLRAGAQRGFGLANFRFRGSCAERKSNHGADLHVRSGELGGGERNPIRVHANAREIVLERFAAEL